MDACIICGPKTQSLARATARLRSVFIRSLPGNLVMARSGDSNGCNDDGPATAWWPEVDDSKHVSSDITAFVGRG